MCSEEKFNFGVKRRGNEVLPMCPVWTKYGGAPSRIRTWDLLIRSQALYPAEPRAHNAQDV